MRLQNAIASLPTSHRYSTAYESLRAALQTLNIATTEDLVLRHSSEELNQRLLSANIDCTHFSRLYDEIIASLTPQATLGNELLTMETEYRSGMGNNQNTGAPPVDSGLSLPPYGIVEVAGLQSTGKTLFVMQNILKYLITHPMATAHWIDPLGNFSPERTSQLSADLRLTEDSQIDPLTRLHVIGCADLASVYDILEDIGLQLKNPGDHKTRARLVVIDPITPLLGPSLTNESAKGHAHMVTFMRHLSSISREYGLTFFLVNTATKVTPPVQPGQTPPPVTYKASLGPSYSYLTDLSLFLSLVPLSSRKDIRGEFKVKVIKYRNTVSCHFRINSRGVIV